MEQKIKIEELETITTFKEVNMTKTLKVNGKEIKVYSHNEEDEYCQNYDSDVEIDEEDRKLLTEEELDELQEYLDNADWGASN